MSESKTDDISRRHNAMMQRLEQRANALPSTASRTESRNKIKAVDELLERAKREIETGSPSDGLENELEERLMLERNSYQEKRIRDLLVSLRKVLVEKETSLHKKGFSFSLSSKKSIHKKPKAPDSVIHEDDKRAAQFEVIRSEDAIVLQDLDGETRLITGKDSGDISLKRIRNCRLMFAVRPLAVHILDVQDSTLIFLPIDTSIMMHDCHRLKLYASAQQVRVHTSEHVELHLAVSGAVILEACRNVEVAPYTVTYKNEQVAGASGDAWKRPKDFDWLAEGQSPNWKLLEEVQWTVEEIAEAE